MPSSSAAPLRAVPSQWRVDTRVVSTANCMPPNRGRSSATTSNRRVSATGTKRPRSRIRTLVVTQAPASRQRSVPQRTPQQSHDDSAHPLASTLHDDGHENQVAGNIGRDARGEGKVEMAEHESPEQVRFDSREEAAGHSGKCHSSSRTIVSTKQGLLRLGENREHVAIPVVDFHPRSGFVLPTSRPSGLVLVDLYISKIVCRISCFSEVGRPSCMDQSIHDFVSNRWVSLVDHVESIRPTRPEWSLPSSCGATGVPILPTPEEGCNCLGQQGKRNRVATSTDCTCTSTALRHGTLRTASSAPV